MTEREKQYADLLTKQGRKWEFHPGKFKADNTTYEPDFLLLDENLYVEVVGTKGAYRAKIIKEEAL